MTEALCPGLWQVSISGTSHLQRMLCRADFWQPWCKAWPVPALWLQCLPTEQDSSQPLLCWQIAQLWCYMSALALWISRDKLGMFCMPGNGLEPLRGDNLLEGAMVNKMSGESTCSHVKIGILLQQGQLYSLKRWPQKMHWILAVFDVWILHWLQTALVEKQGRWACMSLNYKVLYRQHLRWAWSCLMVFVIIWNVSSGKHDLADLESNSAPAAHIFRVRVNRDVCIDT